MRIDVFTVLRRATSGALVLVLLAAGSMGLGSVVWDPEKGQLGVQLVDRPLPQVLESLAAATGWRIYLEPNTEHRVSASFTGLRPADALQRLLGDLNFALLPDTNGSAALLVYRTTASGATQLLAPPRKPAEATAQRRLDRELIVTLKPGAREGIEALAKRLGARVIGQLDELHAYRLEFPDDAAAQRARTELERSDDVESVEANYLIQPPARLDPLPPNSVPPLALHAKVVPDGEYVVVALIDTPVNAAQAGLKDFMLPAISLAGSADAVAGQLTHGTAMAETILRSLAAQVQGSASTPVRILPIDIYGASPSTTTFDVARGIQAAAGAGPSVINLSLGSASDSPLLQRLVQEVSRQGPLIVAAAGNEPVVTPVFPAAYPEVLAVTAGDRQGRIASYANRGEFVDALAPGTALVRFGDQAFLGTGTSYSTAYISGVAAGLVGSAEKTPAAAASMLRQKFSPPPASTEKP